MEWNLITEGNIMSRNIAKYGFLLLLMVSSIQQFAADVVVAGIAEDFKEKRISLIGYNDHFTNELELLSSAVVDSEGKFSLSTSLDRIRYVQLRSDGTIAHLYVQPGAEYAIQFNRPEEDGPRAFSTKTRTEVIFDELPEGDINARIIGFNLVYERFFNERYDRLSSLLSSGPPAATEEEGGERIIRKSRVQLFDELAHELSAHLDSTYGQIAEPFFAEYVNAVKAEVQMKGKGDRKSLYDNHFKGRAFDRYHPEQVHMFQQFFGGYFDYLRNLLEDKDQVGMAINEHSSSAHLLNIIAKDELVEGEEFRQVLFIHALQELWGRRGVKKKNVYALLQDLKTETAYPEVRGLVDGTLAMMSKATAGYTIEDLQFSDISNVERRISEFSDTPVVLHFWTTWSSSCQREMPQATELRERYGPDVKFLNICLDEDRKAMEDYLRAHPDEDAVHLFGGDKPLLTEQYAVHALPTYHVLEEDGEIEKM